MRGKRFICKLLCAALLLVLFPATAMASGGLHDGPAAAPDTDKAVCISEETVSGTSAVDDTIGFTGSGAAVAAKQASGGSGIGWWIWLAAVACAVAALIIFRRKVLKLLPRVLYIFLIIALVISSVMPAAALVNPQAVNRFLGSSATVSFETNGGSEVPAAAVPTGGRLAEVPTPAKADYAFTGWYNDAALSEPFYSDVPITGDKTLYASYTPTRTNVKQFEDPGKYVEDCGPDYTVSIVSTVELTAQNLSGYVRATAYSLALPELSVSGSGGVYTISPAAPYPAGGHYRFELMDSALSFEGESGAIRYWDFRIRKDPVSNVKLNNNIKYVLWPEVVTLGEGAYYVPASLGIKKGDTVCFWDGEYNGSTLFCKILRAASPKKVGGKSMSMLTTEESRLEDILDEVDISFEQDVPMAEYLKNVDLETLALSARNSAGTREMSTLLACAVSHSPSFRSMMAQAHKPGSGDEALSPEQPGAGGVLLDDGVFLPVEEYDDFTIEVDDLIEGLTVSAKVCRAHNPNFPVTGEEDWAGINLTFTYDTVIKGKVELKAVFSVTEYIKSTMQGTKEWDGSNLIFDYALNNYSQTELDLSILIKSKNTKDSEYLDITKEIEELTKPDNEDDSDVTGILDEVLGAKGDYIELINAPLLSLPISIVVFQINFDVNFVVKVNFAAGISAHTTIMASRQVGLCGSTYDGIDTYSNSLTGNGRYSFDFYCAGYLGFKAGLRLEISLSVIGLPGLGKLGVGGEVGAYLDLYGFMHLNLSKPYTYGESTRSVQGGLYMEVGVYVEVSLFAKSDWFGAKAAYTLLEEKFPLFELGDQYVFFKFADTGGSIIINDEQYPLYGSAGLLDAQYIDIKTGEIVNSGDIEDMSEIMPNFSVQFSSPYFEYDDTDYNINVLKSLFGQDYSPEVPSNTRRLDAVVYVYDTGNNLAFSHQQDGDAMKQINLTWIDSSVNVSDYPDLDAIKATYVADLDGEQQQVAEKWVPFGSIPGSIDYSAYFSNCSFTGYTNDPGQPIYEDTVYTIHLKRYERLVSYLTYHDGSWHFDVYAVKIGDVPNIPEGYDSPGPGLGFTGWIGTPGASAAGLGITNDIAAVNYDATNLFTDENLLIWEYPVSDYVYLDLKTTEPLYSVSGTYDECLSGYYDLYQGVPLNKSSQYLYEAQYDGGPFTVSLVYPAMSYTYCGQKEKFDAATYTYEADFNEPVKITNVISYPGCELPAWDADGDGVADYSTFAELPRATHDITLTAIIRQKTYTVTVLDKDGDTDRTLTVIEGGLPSVIKTEPDYPDGDDYQFAYWAVSKPGGEFAEWNKNSDPGVFADWTIKPIYERAYTVTFDFAGGKHDGDKSETIKLVAGTYYIDDLIDYYPEKAADVRNTYVFDDWNCGSSFTVSEDMTIKAKYTAAPIIYTTEFNTSVGAFEDGETHASCTGDYDSSQDFIDDFLSENETLAAVYTADKVYTFESWEEISLSGTHNWYEAQWSWDYRDYTVTFDAGDGAFSNGDKTKTVTMPYGASGNLSALSADIVTPEIGGYTYDHTGWVDQAAQSYGTGGGYTIHGDTTFTAVYEQGDPILYTVTLNANGGTFPGGGTTRAYSGYYEDPVNVTVGDPTRAGYDFDGWSPAIPAAFTETVTVYAQWQESEYTVTFDANGGAFADSSTVKEQTYHYLDAVTPPDDPAKAEDLNYIYEFIGWDPSPAPVTGDCTYTAAYRATLKSGAATGVYVSDGTHTEDINCNGFEVSGYTYEVQTCDIGGVLTDVPLLTVTGGGLTFSGSSSTVYAVIDTGCGSVSFDGLSLSGSYPMFFDNDSVYHAGTLVVAGDPANTLTVSVSGSCEIKNTYDGAGALYSARIVSLSGQGAGPSLSVGSVGRGAVYSAGLEVNNLTLSAVAAAGSGSASAYAITGEGAASDTLWRFVDSSVTARGRGAVNVVGNVAFEGDSDITLVSIDNTKAALLATGGGYLRFVGFTGEFGASYQDAGAAGPAVQATAGITFAPDVSGYDLGGAEVALCGVSFDGIDSYYTFVVNPGAIPQPQAHVVPVP